MDERKDALETCTSVDAGLWQCGTRAIGCLVVLHEYKVPEFHEPITVRIVEWATVGPERRTAVDVNLGTRTTWSGIACLPEIVLVAEALDAFHRNTNLLMPDCFGFIVGFVNSDPQTVTIETEHFGHQIPSPRNGISFEVITETEVAEHLEEHKMSLCPTYFVEVVVLTTRTHALLNSDRAIVWSNFITHEVGLERHHAGNGEQQSRIVGNQRGRRHDDVTALGKETGEGPAELIGRARDFRSRRRRHECPILSVSASPTR